MHIPDGFISPQITIPAYGLAAPIWVYAARRHFGPASVESLPMIGSLTALAFVIQTIMIPLPGGTSTHLLGMTLLALLYSPLAAFVCEGLVLLLQALFFGAGGITVLGVNALAMGLIGPGAAWVIYKMLRRFHQKAAIFLAAYVGTQLSTLTVAMVLGLQHYLSPQYYPVPLAVTLTAMMVPSFAVTGLAEGAYTVLTFLLLQKISPRDLV